MKIFKVSDTQTTVGELSEWLHKKEVQTGDRFAISWKKGKHRKLRAYHLDEHSYEECDTCGHYRVITLRKGDTSKTWDQHFRSSIITMNF